MLLIGKEIVPFVWYGEIAAFKALLVGCEEGEVDNAGIPIEVGASVLVVLVVVFPEVIRVSWRQEVSLRVVVDGFEIFFESAGHCCRVRKRSRLATRLVCKGGNVVVDVQVKV